MGRIGGEDEITYTFIVYYLDPMLFLVEGPNQTAFLTAATLGGFLGVRGLWGFFGKGGGSPLVGELESLGAKTIELIMVWCGEDWSFWDLNF